jgi:hypothetical protein
MYSPTNCRCLDDVRNQESQADRATCLLGLCSTLPDEFWDACNAQLIDETVPRKVEVVNGVIDNRPPIRPSRDIVKYLAKLLVRIQRA